MTRSHSSTDDPQPGYGRSRDKADPQGTPPKKDFADTWIDAIEKMAFRSPASDTPQPDTGKQPEREYRITESQIKTIGEITRNDRIMEILRMSPITPALELTKVQRGREYVRGYLHGMGDGIETSEKREAALIQRTRLDMASKLCAYLHYSHSENERDAVEAKHAVARNILKGRMFEDMMILEALEELRVKGNITLVRYDEHGDPIDDSQQSTTGSTTSPAKGKEGEDR